MPRITVQMIEGRTIDQKRKMVEELTEVICRNCNVPETSVSILFQDMRREDFARNGKLVCDE